MEMFQDFAKSINIGGWRELVGLGCQLFGSTIVAGVSQVVNETLTPSKTEIDKLDVVSFASEEDVARFQVEVQQSLFVKICYG